MLHLLVARLGDNNAVVISQKTMASLMDCSLRTVQRATRELANGNWVELRRLGETGQVNAYVLNDRVAWAKHRDGLRYSLFSAAVVLSAEEQPDMADLGAQEPLQRLPSLFPGERQLPTGEGLPPPSEPDFPGMEPDLPTRRREGGDG